MQRWRALSVFILALTAVYLYVAPSATIFYAATALLHTGLGVLVTLGGLLFFLLATFRPPLWLLRIVWLFFFAGGTLGIVLIKIGPPHPLKGWLYAHIALSAIGVLFLAS